jgi:hypothetical protein
MRKTLIHPVEPKSASTGQDWLNLEQIAAVEVTSEAAGFPIDSALGVEQGSGWRASEPGEQRVRIIFDEPVSLSKMRLYFHEADRERTQEFVLTWSDGTGQAPIEIVRQQWNFSPSGSTDEIEEFAVTLNQVRILELTIQPDKSLNAGIASLSSWRVR